MFKTDSELFDAVKQSDEKAFDRLYERYWEIIYKRAFVYLQDSDQCIEIVNDIFLNIWHRRTELKIIVFKNYITAAARYRVYNVLKKRKTEKINYVESYENFYANEFILNDAEENLSSKELVSRMISLLNKLPKRCKEIFILSRINHLTNDEIADQLLISKRTVENQIAIAIKFLRKNLGIISLLMLQVIFNQHYL